jgi:DNA-directed RNA polymerase subunit alpha
MGILAFQKPDKVIMHKDTEFFGQFEFRPLEKGYGVTIGNSLRRILLSSLEGYAITSVKITGVEHEFSTVKGVIEDVTEMVMNLKQVRFKRLVDGIDNEKIYINIKGQEQFLAGEIGKHTNSFRVLNPELVICNMEPFVHLEVELTVDKGRVMFLLMKISQRMPILV